MRALRVGLIDGLNFVREYGGSGALIARLTAALTSVRPRTLQTPSRKERRNYLGCWSLQRTFSMVVRVGFRDETLRSDCHNSLRHKPMRGDIGCGSPSAHWATPAMQ